MCFVHMFKFQENKENKFQKNLQEIKIFVFFFYQGTKIILKKRFLGKATGLNDHYMISMDGQRPKIGSN